MNKEQIYDEKIHPLMGKIIEICKEHKIAMISSFSIPNDEDPNLLCTSALCNKDFDPPKEFIQMYKIIYKDPRVALINVLDKDGKIVISEAFLG